MLEGARHPQRRADGRPCHPADLQPAAGELVAPRGHHRRRREGQPAPDGRGGRQAERVGSGIPAHGAGSRRQHRVPGRAGADPVRRRTAQRLHRADPAPAPPRVQRHRRQRCLIRRWQADDTSARAYVGRHSIPDPEDSAREDLPEEPPTQRFARPAPREPDYRPGYAEHDYPDPGYRETEYDRPAYRHPAYPATAYPDGDYDEPGYDQPEYDQPEYGDTNYDELPHAGTDYPEPAPDYAQSQPGRGGGGAPPPRLSGRQHGGEWEGGEWTGSHRAVATGRRGVSIGVIAVLVAVVVVVGGFILWRFFGDALSNRTDAAAARCVDGELAVAVVADPSIADQVQTLANTYNKSAAPVADRCVKVNVKP